MSDRAAFLRSIRGRPYDRATANCWHLAALAQARLFGRQGAPGATIVTGLVPPMPADGRDGDFWIEDRTASNRGRRMYGPKAGGAWPGTPWTIQVAGLADVPGPIPALDAVRTILSLSGDPAPADVPAGTIRVAKNAATGRLTLWANDGGALVDLLTFTPAS